MTDKTVSRRGLLKGALAVPLLMGASIVGLAGSAGGYPWGRTLKQGSTGADVAELQIRVAGWAASSAQQTYVGVDGAFGSVTTAAVKRFQSAYGLGADGIAGPQTQATLNALESGDGSTQHFEWTEFTSHDGSGFSGGKVPSSTVQENVRRLMYKLEALRHKADDRAVTINSGFRSVAYNQAIGGATNSMHVYGVAADTAVSGLSTYNVYRIAETCGFSGLESYQHSWQHVDSRIEYPYGSQFRWWESGIV